MLDVGFARSPGRPRSSHMAGSARQRSRGMVRRGVCETRQRADDRVALTALRILVQHTKEGFAVPRIINALLLGALALAASALRADEYSDTVDTFKKAGQSAQF